MSAYHAIPNRAHSLVDSMHSRAYICQFTPNGSRLIGEPAWPGRMPLLRYIGVGASAGSTMQGVCTAFACMRLLVSAARL